MDQIEPDAEPEDFHGIHGLHFHLDAIERLVMAMTHRLMVVEERVLAAVTSRQAPLDLTGLDAAVANLEALVAGFGTEPNGGNVSVTPPNPDQQKLDADVAAINAAVQAITAEINNLKNQPAAAALDFTGLDSAVSGLDALVPAPPAPPAPTPPLPPKHLPRWTGVERAGSTGWDPALSRAQEPVERSRMDYSVMMIEAHVSRFLTRYRWRCRKCNSPWYGAVDMERAVEGRNEHKCHSDR